MFYQSKDDAQLSVQAIIRTPDLLVKGPFEMMPVDYKLYYVDVVFTQTGTHVVDVYENGARAHREFIVVSAGNLIVYPEGNVI